QSPFFYSTESVLIPACLVQLSRSLYLCLPFFRRHSRIVETCGSCDALAAFTPMPVSSHQESGARGWFTTTHWSVVLQARDGDSTAAHQALGRLCQTYWGPINGYIRGRGYSPADADDLTQQFFARFLERQQYRSADQQRGRFRSFLLTCVKNFLLKEWERAGAQKRGGGWVGVSLDETFPDGGAHLELPDERTADHVFEQNWALTLL